MDIIWTLYGSFMATRNRLTDQAIADTKAAETAVLVKVKRGWQVQLCNGKKCVALDDKDGKPVVYSAKNAAKKALGRHNPEIEIEIKSQL